MNVVSLVMLLPPLLAVTTILHSPGVVLVPTIHDQEMLPEASATLGISPAAVLGPDL